MIIFLKLYLPTRNNGDHYNWQITLQNRLWWIKVPLFLSFQAIALFTIPHNFFVAYYYVALVVSWTIYL